MKRRVRKPGLELKDQSLDIQLSVSELSSEIHKILGPEMKRYQSRLEYKISQTATSAIDEDKAKRSELQETLEKIGAYFTPYQNYRELKKIYDSELNKPKGLIEEQKRLRKNMVIRRRKGEQLHRIALDSGRDEKALVVSSYNFQPENEELSHQHPDDLIEEEADAPETVKPEDDREEVLEKFLTNTGAEKKRELSDEDVLERAESSSNDRGIREVSTSVFARDPYVAEFAKRWAAGVCQLCCRPAPFNDKAGNPYLETHHIVWLSEGGNDSIENVVALCPNCHRKMHVMNSQSDINELRRRTAEIQRIGRGRMKDERSD